MARDFDLLDAWRAGDTAAANELLKRCFAPLRRFFDNKVDSGTEDLIQQTLLKCVERRDRCPEAWSFRRYMFVAARDQLYEHFRRKSAAQFDPSVQSLRDLQPSPSSVARQRQRNEALHDALRRIPVELQVALELYYWQDLRAPEVAEILELPIGTLRSRLRRGIALLRERIQIADVSGSSVDSVEELDRWATSVARDDP